MTFSIKSSCPVSLGTLIWRCSKAWIVKSHPLGVLCKKPTWSKKGSITDSIVPVSSPRAAERVSSPTGPPSYESIKNLSNLRSLASKPQQSTLCKSSDSFTKLRECNGPALLSGKADRWSKWGEIELEKGTPKITFDNPEAYGRIHFTGIVKLNIDLAQELIDAAGKHIGESLQVILQNHDFEVLESFSWHNIVYPWDLISGNRMSLNDNLLYRNSKIEKNVTIKGDVSIGKGTVIRSGTYLTGPVSIGEGCDIGPNSVIGPSVS